MEWPVSTQSLGLLPHPVHPPQANHIVWVNEHAAFVGGAEQYIYETARLLAAQGVRNTLLYDPLARFDTTFLAPFASAYPLVRPAEQIPALDGDIVYLHRVSGAEKIRAIGATSDRVVRFFHDHRPLCLREHKYTTIGQKTCTRTIGAHCYSCLGFVGRRDGHLALRTLGPLRDELEESRRLAGSVVASRYLRQHLVDHGFDARRVHVAPLFARAPRALVVPRDVTRLAFVGQLVRGKGVDLLLEAMTRIPDYARLTVVGSGAQELELRAMAERLGLASRVLFTGDQRGLDRDRIVASAAALVVPSRSPETFGLSGLEALRYGTPVVASHVGGISEWLDDGESGLLVPPGDVARLADALRTLIEAPAYARALGDRGREIWKSRFQPEHHLGALRAAFGKVIA